MTRVNIYYGGRGLIEDPTNYVMGKISEVLDELNIQVKKYNLYEDMRGISALPKTLKTADAIILAVSVEWLGIGGLMQQFLDACWLYGDKDTFKSLYMMPVVISTTYGEKEAYSTLIRAWEILGGRPCEGIYAYVNNTVDFETNTDYAYLIEKKAETFYRTFTKKIISFPSSSCAVIENVAQPKAMNLTPQESEQLSMYVSNDNYVKKQKEDIEELTQMFKNMMGDKTEDKSEVSEKTASQPSHKNYIDILKEHYNPIADIALSFTIQLTDLNQTLVIETDNKEIKCYYGETDRTNVLIKTTQSVVENILDGITTLEASFMSGALSAKGDFKILKIFDKLFKF